MITYSETQGEKPFDWFEFLSREAISLESGNAVY